MDSKCTDRLHGMRATLWPGAPMIQVHRLNGKAFLLNHRHIEIMEANPDTVITLTNDRRYLVQETPEQVTDLILAYHQKIFQFNIEESVDI